MMDLLGPGEVGDVDQAVDPVPVNRALASLIRAWEQARELR